MNDGGDCRIARATPGVLIIIEELEEVFSENVSIEISKAEFGNTSVKTVDNPAEGNDLIFKCNQCAFTNSTEKGLWQQTRIKHRISQLDGAEDIFMDESEYTIKALIVTKTIKEGEDTLKFCIHTDVDPNHHTEITHISEESGKVYDGEDKDYNKGDCIENVFTFTISKRFQKRK